MPNKKPTKSDEPAAKAASIIHQEIGEFEEFVTGIFRVPKSAVIDAEAKRPKRKRRKKPAA